MPTSKGPNGRIHYRDEGSGDPPLVFLHAFPLSGAMWEHQIATVSPRHRIVVPDLRGFGASDVPVQRGAYSLDGWADDVAALIASLGLERVVLVGLSMGGYVAFALVRRHPQVLAGLVLADTRPSADTPEVRARREEQQQLIEAAGEPVALAGPLLEPLVGPTSTRREAVLATARTLLAGNRAPGVVGALEAMKARPDSTGDLAGIVVPTLVVVGEQDQLSPPDVAEEMAGAISGASLAVIPDAGHLSNMENPAAFERALEGFLGGVAG